jgi:hypothetical protein
VSLPWLAIVFLWAQAERGQKFNSRELEREASARTSGTKTPKPETPKSRNLKFCLESLVAPSNLAFDHGLWVHGLGTKKMGAITQKL